MIGLSRADFLALTLEEFSEVYERWQEGRQVQDQTRWEVMRAQTAMTLQPFVKSRLNPRTMFPLPWDAKVKEGKRRRPRP